MRPLIVLVWVAALLLFITLDSLALDFTVRDAWVSLYEVLTLTAVGGYFTLRSLVDKRPTRYSLGIPKATNRKAASQIAGASVDA